MKTMIYSLTLAAMMVTSFSSCNDDNDPVLTQPLTLLRRMQ